jgi:pyruvate dehydrogenase E2 component (dihydrolipoamide acetyltransferase)
VFEFKLPDLGEGIHEGEVLKWHVKEGDTIEEDAPLIDVETDKAAVTIPSPRAGKIVKLSGGEGDTVEVGQVIATIDEAGGEEAAAAAEQAAAPATTEQAKAAEVPSAEAPGKKPPTAPPPATEPSGGAAPREPQRPTVPTPPGEPDEPPAAPAAQAAPPPVAGTGRRVAAAPATRRLARELQVDLGQVPGSGPGGRVTADDVRRFTEGGAPRPAPAAAEAGERPAAAPPAAAGAGAGIPFLDVEALPDFAELGEVEREPIRSIRRRVARKMVTSMVLVPHVAHMDDADVTALEQFRRKERQRREGEPGGRLTLLPFVAKALTACLARFPMFNASLDPIREEIVYKKFYNVGVAVDTPKGLMVPVVQATDRKSVLEISADIERLAAKGREGQIEVGDLRGGTITITNVGPLGGTRLIPTINYPEVAILGMGRATERPVVVDGEITVRTILPLTLAFDHRVADGADAARFMNALIRYLSDPLAWLLEA